jgi:hypothetical protein
LPICLQINQQTIVGKVAARKAALTGGLHHNWDPYWSSSLFGSYAAVRYNGNAQANYCAAFAAGVAGRSFLTSLAIRTSTLHSSAWSPAGLPSRT